MAIVTKGVSPYVYRSGRRDGRVTSEYRGGDPLLVELERLRLDEAEAGRRRRENRRIGERLAREADDEADALVEES